MMDRDIIPGRAASSQLSPVTTGNGYTSYGQQLLFEQEAASGQQPSIREFLNVLRRRKAIALQTLVLVLALGVVVTLMTKPLYRSTSKILVEGRANTVALNDTKEPFSQLFIPNVGHDAVTQVEILRSPALAAEASKATGIPPSALHLDVQQVSGTDVIQVGVISDAPAVAQRFADALPEVYLKQIRGNRINEVSTALSFADGRLKEGMAKLSKAELALEQFKMQAGVVDPQVEREEAITAATAARGDADKARAQLASLQAQLAALSTERQRTPAFIVTPTTITNNQQISAVQEQIASLERERSKLLFLYKPSDDKVKQVNLQIADLKHQLARVPGTVTTITRTPNPAITTYDQKIAEVRAEMRAAAAEAGANSVRAASLNADLTKFNPIERTQNQLQREVELWRNNVEAFRGSVEDLTLRLQALQAKNDPVTIMATASPAAQITPQVFRNAVLTILLGILLAGGAAILQESLDDHISNEDEARHMLGAAVLGHSPLISGGQSPVLSLDTSNSSPLLESFRMLRSNVQFTLFNTTGRVLMVTSTVPEEGKTSTAANLAIAMALDKRNVILVDADMRRPRLHEIFNLAAQPGLSNILVGQQSLPEVLQETHIPGLRVVTAGVLPPNSAELINSSAMDGVMRALEDSGKADVIIFDSPPCLATADAQVLAAKVDGVLYVMELGRVSKSAVQRAFEMLHQANANVLGIVINKAGSGGRSEYYGYSYYTPHDYEVNRNGRAANGLNGGYAPSISANGHAMAEHTPFDDVTDRRA